MSVASLISGFGKLAVKHGPEILTGLAVAGTINTAVMASTATAKAQRIVDEDEIKNGFDPDPKVRWKRRATLVWRLYIPTAISGLATIGAVICSNRLALKRESLISAALVTTQTYLSRYANAVEEIIDEEHRGKIQERVADIVVDQTTTPDILKREGAEFEQNILIQDAGGDELFLDSLSGRYFRSSLTDVRTAIVSAKEQIHSDNYITINDLYDMLNLEKTAQGDYLGWTSYSKFAVDIRPRITKDGRPVAVLTYELFPKAIDLRWE